MALKGLIFTSIFAGETFPQGIAWQAQRFHPYSTQPDYLNAQGNLVCGEYYFSSAGNLAIAQALYLRKRADAAPELPVPTHYCPDDGTADTTVMWRQILRKQPYRPRSLRVLGVAIASLPPWGKSSSRMDDIFDQWIIVRQISDGGREFLKSVSDSPLRGFRAEWTSALVTGARDAQIYNMHALITGDPLFASRPLKRSYD